MPTGIRRTPRQSRDVLQAASQASALVHGPGGRDRVELVCVVEDGRLGGLGRAQVVMHSDRVQELGPNVSFERRREQLLHRPGGRDRVELVCVVEHRRLGGFGRAQVVMNSDRVQELGPNFSLERWGPVLDQP